MLSRPALHALLNSGSAVMLVLGWLAIKGRGPWAATGPSKGAHKRCMVGALALSAVFLGSYLHYHYTTGHREFWTDGWLYGLYLAVLVPHVILAAAMVPAIAVVVTAALRGRFDRHRRVARWTLPVWLYVSVTGVIVYWMLYAMAPPGV